MDEALKKVRDFADKAHDGQTRKYAEEKYIRHPERVMYLCLEYTSERSVLAAALLHDVLEDTPVTASELEAFLATTMESEEAAKTQQLVVELTDVYVKESYPRLNRRHRKSKEAARLGEVSAEAQTIKYADIIDNASDITPHEPDFARVYLSESLEMLSAMDKGHPELFERAKHTVQVCREQLEAAVKEG